MKINFIKYIALIGIIIGFGACNPYQDEFVEIDTAVQTLTQDIEITLEDEDYELSENSNAARFGNFSNADDAKEGIPNILKAKFPFVNGDGSFASVTYALYNGSSPDLRGDQLTETVTDADYDALGFRFGNFSNLNSDIPKYATFKAPNAGDGDYMDITHDLWNGSFVERDVISRAVYTVAYGWMYAMPLPEDAYGDFFNESGIDFSNRNEGFEKVPVYLKATLLFAQEGDRQLVQFNHDDRNEGPTPEVGLYIFTDGDWVLYNDRFQVTDELLTFGLDGGVWVPDNTIKYTLSFGDYATIVASSAGTDATRGNMNSFGNFNYTNPDGGGSSWSSNQLLDALVVVIKDNFPNDTAAGQKFEVTFSAYTGATVNITWKIIINDAGQYVLNQ